MGLILDTCILIEMEKGRFDFAMFAKDFALEPIFLSSITISELFCGAVKSQNLSSKKKRVKFCEEIYSKFPVLDFTKESAILHAQIWADLQRRGQIIGAYDMIIATSALEREYALITLNVKEFVKVPKLKVIQGKKYIL